VPRLSALTKQLPVSVTFAYEDESLTVVFDRNKITQNWARKVRQAIETESVDEAVYAATLEILIDWDVVDDEGNKIPPSMEILSQLPLAAFGRLSEAIGNASVPSSEEGNGSSEPSSVSPPDQSTASTPPQPVSPPTPQNGDAPSPSPQPSEPLRT
jgi:hypothetical protein